MLTFFSLNFDGLGDVNKNLQVGHWMILFWALCYIFNEELPGLAWWFKMVSYNSIINRPTCTSNYLASHGGLDSIERLFAISWIYKIYTFWWPKTTIVTIIEIRKHSTFNSLIKEENISYILTKRWYLVYLHMVPGTIDMTQ